MRNTACRAGIALSAITLLLFTIACGGSDSPGSDVSLACTFFSKADVERVLGGEVGEPDGSDGFDSNSSHTSFCQYRLRERDDKGQDTLSVQVGASTRTNELDSEDFNSGYSATISGEGVAVSLTALNANKAPLKSEVEKLAESIHGKAEKSCIVNSRCEEPTPDN